MRRIPLQVIVSHSLLARLATVNRCPQNCSISGMNGSESSSPRSSSVARISAWLRTSTTSPMRRPSRPPSMTSLVRNLFLLLG
jgi:hypothetical protein